MKKKSSVVPNETPPIETTPDFAIPEFIPELPILETSPETEININEEPITESPTENLEVFSKTESKFQIFINILNPKHENSVLEILASLGKEITGFTEEDFKKNFQKSSKIKLSYISFYEAVHIQQKLLKYHIKIQVLEREQ